MSSDLFLPSTDSCVYIVRGANFISLPIHECFLFAFSLSGNKLTSEIAFSVVSVFNAMQFSIGTLPYGIKMITEVHVALCRIQVGCSTVVAEVSIKKFNVC